MFLGGGGAQESKAGGPQQRRNPDHRGPEAVLVALAMPVDCSELADEVAPDRGTVHARAALAAPAHLRLFERANEVDWRTEMEAAGMKASDVFEAMVQNVAEKLTSE